MKRRALKITQNTLFVYKTVTSINNKVTDNTEPSSTMTTTVSGIAGTFLK